MTHEFTARRTSLESLGSLYMATEHTWCARQGDGNGVMGIRWTGLLTSLSHHTYCDLLLKSPAVILSGDKKQAAGEHQARY